MIYVAVLAAFLLVGMLAADHDEPGVKALIAAAVLVFVFWASYSAGRDAAMYTLAREPIPAVIHDVAVYRLKIMRSQASEQPR